MLRVHRPSKAKLGSCLLDGFKGSKNFNVKQNVASKWFQGPKSFKVGMKWDEGDLE